MDDTKISALEARIAKLEKELAYVKETLSPYYPNLAGHGDA